MMMGPRSTGRAALVGMAALWLAACSTPVKLDETPVESRTPIPVAARAVASGSGGTVSGVSSGAAAAGGEAASRLPQSQVATVDLSKAAAAGAGAGGAAAQAVAANLGRVVLFDFDSFVVKDEFRGLVEGHARALSADKGKRLVIEGHTDERGGREYNLALGQKRAEAVAKSLALLGASDSQLEAVSFGKERPVAEGHDEEAWARNRRAELKDR